MTDQMLLKKILALFSAVELVEDDPGEWVERVSLETWSNLASDRAYGFLREELAFDDDDTEPLGWAASSLWSRIRAPAFRVAMREGFRDQIRKSKARLRRFFESEAKRETREDPDFAAELRRAARKIANW